MGLKMIEDRPTPKEVYGWRVYVYAFISAFGAMLYGYDSAFIGGTIALASFRAEFGINATNSAATSANIVSTYQAGAIFGALIAFPLTEKFGRRIATLAAAAVFSAGAAIHLGSNSATGLTALYVGRAIGGIGVGIVSLVVPIYIAEISPPAIRGRLVGLYEMLLQIGGLLGFWINYAVNATMAPGRPQWRVPIAIQLIPGGILCIFGFLLLESPRWLRSKGRTAQADKNLMVLRNLPIDHPYMQEENAMVDAQLAMEAAKTNGGALTSRLRELMLPGIRNRMGIAFMLFLFQNGTGINAINYYSPTVFASLGITGTSTGLLTTGIFGIVKNVATLIWLLFLIDHLGRRLLMIGGAIAASFFMYWIGIVVALAKPSAATGLTPAGTSAVAAIYLWTASYGPTWNGTPWVFASEVLPQHVRTVGMALLSASQWVWQFAIARATPYMFIAMANYGVYIFFASLTVCGGIFVYFIVPETKGVTLEDMDRIFGFVSTHEAEMERERAAAALQKRHSSHDDRSDEKV